MWCVAAIDVAGGDLGGGDVVVDDRRLGAVVADTAHTARARRRASALERHDLAALLAVEAEVPIGLLDHAVRLAGHDVAVVGQPDEQTLTAAAQGQQHRVGIGGAHRPDRDRPLEGGHRASERLDEFDAVGLVPRHDRGDHLRVGGDLLVDAQRMIDPEIGVIVDVAVERRHDVRSRTGPSTMTRVSSLVERVRIGLAR